MAHSLRSIWLFSLAISIIFMIFIGGLTRLTDSGLSMTEWKPVTGLIPPLSEPAWEAEFTKYKNSPEYKLHNFNMNLAEFKPIYLLEFFHRLAGRFTALLYALPLLFFLITKKIFLRQAWPLIAGFVLLLLQGFLGWYMVKSGLIDQPKVSHFRLAAHLMLAVFLYIIIYWRWLKEISEPILLVSNQSVRAECRLNLLIIILLLLQILLGGLVAGLDAGLIYNNFPLMGEYFIPSEIYSANIFSINLSDPVLIQFLHRIGAYLVASLILLFIYFSLKIGHKRLTKSIILIFLALIGQMGLGILTILYCVPVPVALLHQLGAILLLSALLWSYFLLKGPWQEE